MKTTWHVLDITSNEPLAAQREAAAFVDFLRGAAATHAQKENLVVYYCQMSAAQQIYFLSSAATELVLKADDLAAFRSKLAKLDSKPDLRMCTLVTLDAERPSVSSTL